MVFSQELDNSAASAVQEYGKLRSENIQPVGFLCHHAPGRFLSDLRQFVGNLMLNQVLASEKTFNDFFFFDSTFWKCLV